MTKALKKKSKAIVLAELAELCEHGRALLSKPCDDMQAMAERTVEKMEWVLAVLQMLPQMSRSIAVVADFNRAAQIGRQGFCATLEEEQSFFATTLTAQLEVLENAVEKWRKSNTRPLD